MSTLRELSKKQVKELKGKVQLIAERLSFSGINSKQNWRTERIHTTSKKRALDFVERWEEHTPKGINKIMIIED